MYDNKRTINSIHDIYRSDTLNIFSDASFKQFAAAYSIIAVCKDTIIDNATRVHKKATSNAEELRGLRAALSCALIHRNEYKYINIFSDSLLCIDGLRKYSKKWNYIEDNSKGYDFSHGSYYKSKTHRVEHSDIYVECFEFLKKLRETNDVALFHQKGHVKLEGNGNAVKNRLRTAGNDFKKFNDVNACIDANLMRYISTYNSTVDHISRMELLKCELKDNYTYKTLPETAYSDLVKFIPTNQIEF